ncbi:MAG: hypothetical protein IT470_08305 [Pseudomonadales bacterium]|nr:hypothetical protein [Pseudomonadales bacterium]
MSFSIPHSHPALPGHFPGNPVVPGVVLLDHVLSAAGETFPQLRVCGIKKMKWLQPLLPVQTCEIQWGKMREDQLRFSCWCEEQRIAEGSLQLEAMA